MKHLGVAMTREELLENFESMWRKCGDEHIQSCALKLNPRFRLGIEGYDFFQVAIDCRLPEGALFRSELRYHRNVIEVHRPLFAAPFCTWTGAEPFMIVGHARAVARDAERAALEWLRARQP